MDIKLDIYNEECGQLAKSMYLKFDLHALAVERWYRDTDSVNPDKRTWLHYMNLAGIYHEYNTPMTIKSLDTFEDIPFDKETLKNHPTTLTLYREFGKYYRTLLKRYPDNDVLIRGILYGQELDDVINMDDFHIVGYNTSLVEVQEYDLISTLNKHLSIKGTSAGCPNYVECENEYPLAILSYVANYLTPLIKRIRFENSKTYQANTFYIWSHINSVINLEEYKSVLSYDDVMFLFKNIIRLKNGLCSKEVFQEVLTTIVTPKMIDAYYLESNVKVSSLNAETHSVDAEWVNRNVLTNDVKPHHLTTVVNDHIARSNYRLSDASGDLTGRLYRDYNSNRYPELTLYDNREHEGNVRELLINVDYAYLFGALGTINRYYEITLPHTGENLTLQHNDWMTVYTRIRQIKFGIKTEHIPHHDTTQLYRYTPISRLELIEGGLDLATADRILDIIGIFPTIHNDIAAIQSYIENFVNTKSTIVSILTRSYNKRNNIYIGELNSKIFGSYSISYQEEGTNFEQWLDNVGINLNEMSLDTLYQLEYNILTTVVGISGDGAETMVNMIGGLLQKFLSYKTNISQKMSDTITLTLSGRPNWIEFGNDLSDTGEFIPVMPTIECVPQSNDVEDININEIDVGTSMSRLGAVQSVDIGGKTVMNDIPINSNNINLPPTSLIAEILE